MLVVRPAVVAHWLCYLGVSEVKRVVKGLHAVIQNDDGTGLLFVKKSPRIGWFIIKTRNGATVYDGGDEREAARAAVKHMNRNARILPRGTG